MNENFEPTLLPFNKNITDNCEILYESISINKSLIDKLCDKEDLESYSCFLTAVVIVLTKYTNSENIFILTDINSNEVPLIVNDKNRSQSVADYMDNIEKLLNQPVNHADISESRFNFIYNNDNLHEYFNTTLSVGENSNSYVLKLKFDACKYTHYYIKSFLRSIKKVINRFIEEGISRLKIEDIKLRDENPLPEFENVEIPLVNELFENQVNKKPEKIALTTSAGSYTFRQLNDEANKIANALIKMGIEKGSKVSFMLPRDFILIATFLGIIKAGCIAIPLDISFPDEKIKYIRQNSNSKYIITYESVEGAINPSDLINGTDTSFPEVSLKADDYCCILYTSGSTGNPKGVVISHKGVSNLCNVHFKGNFNSILSLSSIAFDISESDMFTCLCNGNRLIFANDDEIEDIILLSHLIEKTKPEFISLTPTRLSSYMEVPEFCDALNHLKAISLGGELFRKNMFYSIKKHADIDIYNSYGPLETTFTSNAKHIKNPNFIGVGKSFTNYITEVRDIDGNLLPYGVIGELYIGGIGVSKGYYNLEDKTEESFISINGIPYYKTGDYAVQLPSDEIVIKGRMDNQIKLRGQRIELGEIENVMAKYPDVNKVVVIVQNLNDKNHLCAYFTSKSTVNTSDLKAYMGRILSPYMIPTFLIQLDEIPETPNGKTDKKMLPKPEITTENISPDNNIERKILEFSKKILVNEEFGVTDNLFQLGFTSLTLMRLNSDIYHEFKTTLKHADLMNNPSIRQISKIIKNTPSSDEIETIESAASNTYPMSSQQKRLYVLYRQNPTLTNYNLPKLKKFKKAIDVKKLEDAVNKVIGCEEILRTSFDVENGEYIQKIHEKRPVHIDFIEADGDIEKIFHQSVSPFNLERDPLIRIKVIEFEGENYVFRDMHHIICDRITSDLLYAKIRDAYNNKAISTADVQYKDYVFWVQEKQAKEADYWKNKKISNRGSELFADFKRPSVQSFNGKTIARSVDIKAIEKLAKKNSTTIYKLLLLQFIVLIHKYSGENIIQIGTVTSGRTHPKLDETLGMFVNTLPFIQNVSGDDTLKETLMKTEKELADLFANQNYSVEKIIEDHKISTDASRNPLFSIVFIQNTSSGFGSDLNWEGSKFDLTCTLKNSLSSLTIEFDYNTDLYAFEKINSLFNHYINLIENIDQNMDKKIADISILSPAEEKRILEMSGDDWDIKPDSILTLLKRQIRKNPAQTILSDYKSSLNYHDFDLKTNSLANYLKDNFNVEKQDKIVLIANRSIESVLAFYSILKLNAVYVPVNPSAPEKRIRHIIGEVNAKAVLTNRDLDIDDADIVDLNQKSLYSYDNHEPELSSLPELCILHTSGTTGIPKGVQITHENIENFLISAQNHFYDEDIEVFYHTTNIGFDTSLFEIIFSLLNGIQLYVIDENYDFTHVPNNILNQKSMINTVPSKMNLFLTLPNFENIMKNLGQLILAGEALNEKLVKEIHKNYNPVIYNAYGPCEATIFASIKKVGSGKITIGKANINTHIYILNNEKQLCPVGIPGELCIGGKQVSKGYLNRHDETNRYFIDNPFDEGILYCSGDLAYIDSEGEINFIGRKDSQIKINGQRIEIDEINKQIEQNEDIIQAVTVANSKKTQLYSYIVSDKIIDTRALLNNLETVLLPFMVPASIIQIKSVPLNSNGKIDTEKLPHPKKTKHNYVPPTNDTEKAIVKIWEKILDVKQVGINDNFYHLGGDSIKAIRIVSLLQNEGIFSSPRDILNYKTPYLIAQNVADKKDSSYESAEGIFDLLPIQNYFFDYIKRNDYTQEFILESKMDLDINLIQKALDELTNLHDMLRVKFSSENGNPMQEVRPLNTRICEVNEFEINDDLADGISEIIINAKNSLDIYNKLIDVSLVYHDNKSYLVFVIHHLIVDGVSWSIILDDLTYIYNNLASDNRFNFYSCESWLEDIRTLAADILNEDDAFDDSAIICPLSEPQLAVYLDEKVNSKNTAYLTYKLIDCGVNKSLDEIERAILSVIDKHPILKARIADNEILPLLICDSSPDIDVTSDNDISNLMKAFDLEKSLSRFCIIDNDRQKSILFEAHHVINDACGCKIIEDDLISALNSDLDDAVDLGFLYASYDSFKSQFEPEYESAHEFYTKYLEDTDKLDVSLNYVGDSGFVSLPISDVKCHVENFTRNIGITEGNFLNAVFAYTYSCFTDSDKVYFNFTEHGRHKDYAQNAISMFTRTVPVLADFKKDNVKEYLSYFSNLALDSMLNDIYPFRLLASEFNLNNNVMFEYNFDLNDVSDLKNNLVIRKTLTDPISDLLCVVNDIDDGYVVAVTHSDKFSSDAAVCFVKAYADILTQMFDKKMLSDIYCSEIENLKLLKTINKTEPSSDYRDNSSVYFPDNIDYVAPTNKVEKIIADAFEVVFNQKGIGLNDDFIYLGGDSIMAIRVASLLNQNNISCPARDILNFKTPYKIAQNIINTGEISHVFIENNLEITVKEDLINIYRKFNNENAFNLNGSYSYKKWIGDVKELVNNISPEEKQHWSEVNKLLDDSQIKGTAERFHFKVSADYDAENLLMLSEEEYWALAIARAYKKTYGDDIIFNRESYGRDESIADVYRTVGWFTTQYPVPVHISGNYDSLSLVGDVYKLKTAFKEIMNLGLNYTSLIYINDEFEYKHCPVTFNFLSTEFAFENKMFKSLNHKFFRDEEADGEVYGAAFNINRGDDVYSISGNYAKNTFIDDNFKEFIENIKSELKFIADYDFKDENIICALCEPQLEVYFNERNYDMGNAYSTMESVKCPSWMSIDEIKNSIHALINNHPVLKGRIIDNEDMPLMICDSYPLIEITDTDDYSTLMTPFNLEKYLARFFIIDGKDFKYIVYDVHHIINDATGFNIIKNDLIAAFEGNLDDNIDLGFVYASRDSFESKFEPSYESSHEFYKKQFTDINEADSMQKDLNGARGTVSLPVRGIKDSVGNFVRNNNITEGTFLNAVFAYAYSCFTGSRKVCYNFVEHGRHETYTQDSLGMYARTTPVLVDCNQSTVKNYLDYFSNLILNSMSNNDYPFRLLANEFNLNNTVLFEYNFDLNDVSDIKEDIIVKETSKDSFSDFFCVINDLDDGFVIHINHSDMFSKDTAFCFAELYAQILYQMLNKKNLEDINFC